MTIAFRYHSQVMLSTAIKSMLEALVLHGDLPIVDLTIVEKTDRDILKIRLDDKSNNCWITVQEEE